MFKEQYKAVLDIVSSKTASRQKPLDRLTKQLKDNTNRLENMIKKMVT